MQKDTRETFLHSQLQEGLLYKLMKSPAVSGAQSYAELCLAARNEEKRQDELEKRRQYLEKTNPRPSGKTPRPQPADKPSQQGPSQGRI